MVTQKARFPYGKHRKKHEPFECFDGDPMAAKKRMRRFAEFAISKLPPDRLNLVTFILAGQIEQELAYLHDYCGEISSELSAERRVRERRGRIHVL